MDVLGEEERLEDERFVLRPDEAQALAARAHEPAERRCTSLGHRLEQEHVRTTLRGTGLGNEEVGAVVEDRVHGVLLDEPRDLDRPRVVVPLDGLEVCVLDDDELTLGDLEPADDLVLSDLAVVRRAPALLLDRRSASSRWSSRNETSDWRAAGFVAGASPTGIETRPKLSEPFQDVRMSKVEL